MTTVRLKAAISNLLDSFVNGVPDQLYTAKLGFFLKGDVIDIELGVSIVAIAFMVGPKGTTATMVQVCVLSQ